MYSFTLLLTLLGNVHAGYYMEICKAIGANMRPAPSLSAVCDIAELELSRVYALSFASLVVTIPAAHTRSPDANTQIRSGY
jgi:hypothetical protein